MDFLSQLKLAIKIIESELPFETCSAGEWFSCPYTEANVQYCLSARLEMRLPDCGEPAPQNQVPD